MPWYAWQDNQCKFEVSLVYTSSDPLGLQSKALPHKKARDFNSTNISGIYAVNPVYTQQQRKLRQTYSPEHMTESHQFKVTSTPFFSDCQWKLLTKWAHWLRKEHQPNLTSRFTAQQWASCNRQLWQWLKVWICLQRTQVLCSLSSSGWTDLQSAITLTWEFSL